MVWDCYFCALYFAPYFEFSVDKKYLSWKIQCSKNIKSGCKYCIIHLYVFAANHRHYDVETSVSIL